MAPTRLPHVFEYASNLRAEARTVFEFHLFPANLRKINPPWIRLISLEAPHQLTPGALLRLRVSSFFLPQSWEVKVVAVEEFSGSPAKAFILDEALRGPFPFWRHWHEIWQAPDGSTGLVDRVEFLPPGGRAGDLFLPAIRTMLRAMFRARHEATRRCLTEKSGHAPRD